MNPFNPYPLLCQPLFQPKMWGGKRLAELFGKPLTPDEEIGESWEVADLPGNSSALANGPLRGLSLTAAFAQYRHALLGEAGHWPGFPLLVKFIDAHDDLSIQVHPDRETCKESFPEERSKDESWIVVASQPGGRVLLGLRPGITREVFERELRADRVEECLRSIEVKPGDVLHIPPGTVHALGRGVLILEIQEPSDTTFRFYDYKRLDHHGQPRPLHIEQALRSMHYGPVAPVTPEGSQEPWGVRESLVTTSAYSIERWQIQRSFTFMKPTNQPQVVVLLSGSLELQCRDGSDSLKPGDTVILPAALEQVDLCVSTVASAVIAQPFRFAAR